MTRPAPVLRYLRRSLVWVAVAVAVCLFAWIYDTEAAREDHPALGTRNPAVWSYLALGGLAGLAALVRFAGLSGMERRARRPGPAFAMQAVVARSGRRALLHLYPLDVPATGAPVCSVPLIDPSLCPAGDEAFPVEVKGVPRPLGRVAVRSAGGLLWTTGRALATPR